MLQFQEFTSLQDKKDLRDFSSIEEKTYLVPDLVSKTEIQNQILFQEDKKLLEEDSVLRVNELWSKIGLSLSPELNCVSSVLVKSLLSQWLKEEEIEWLQSPGSVHQLFQYMEQLLPLFSQSLNEEIMGDWFRNHPQSYLRWGGWFQVAYKYWNHLQNEKLIPHSWLPAFLVYHPEITQFRWKRKLIFDLSFDLSLIEAELIQVLAQNNEVEVYMPSPDWSQEYQSCLMGYSFLKGESLYTDLNELEEIPIEILFPEVETKKFEKHTTMISEVKSTVAHIRRWVEQGVDVHKIAVLAPDIESYWKPLRSYLAVEGIPVFKNQVALAHLKPSVASWLAHMRLQIGKLSYGDLELSQYGRFSPNTLDYESFSRIFSQIYDEQDLDRNQTLRSRYQQEFSVQEVLTRDEFVVWSLKHWEAQNYVEPIEKLYHQLLLESPPYFQLDLLGWLSYVENLASQLEDSLTQAEGGIYCTNIDSAENLPVEYVCILGLTESALTDVEQTAMSLSDIMSLSEEVGYSLDRNDKNQVEFSLRWSMSQNLKQVVFLSPETDFSGQVEAPASFWMRGALAQGHALEKRESPQLTRWDELQRTDEKSFLASKQWESEYLNRVTEQVKKDWGKAENTVLTLDNSFSLSATQLEKYAQCPFKFYSEKILHLSDLPEIDLDIDRMTRGQLMHLIFEELIKRQITEGIGRKELSQVLDEIFTSSQLILADQRLWSSIKNKYLLLAEKFLKFEGEWSSLYQENQNLATELEIKAYWDNDHSCLTSKETPYPFRGFIDRVDGDAKDYAVIIDYKSSMAQAKNINTWVDEDSFQMSLYAQAIDQGLTALKDRKVIGAVYYVPKNLDRKKGFKDKSYDHLYSNQGRLKSLVEQEEIEDVFIKINQNISKIVTSLSQGEFAPQPKNDDFKICTSCSWRPLCRAPHLN